MTGTLQYHPDLWAHDLGQWWTPLASLAHDADCASGDWLEVLGVSEFFDHHLLVQPALLTPWICLTASAVCAASACRAARLARTGQGESDRREATASAALAFDLAVLLERHRWSGGTVGSVRTSSAELMEAGRAALDRSGHPRPTRPTADGTDAIALVAGWLAVSGHSVTPAAAGRGTRPPATSMPDRIVARIADRARRRMPDSEPLVWGTAHLVERLARGKIDYRPTGSPAEPPTEASANVLLASGRVGQLGRFEARRQHSALTAPAGLAVPDLARLAFIMPEANFLGSVADSLSAARRRDGTESLARPGEIVSWNLRLAEDGHPLAQRRVSGRSAGLGAYMAFRSLSSPGIFAQRDVAFTGQVARDGSLGEAYNARAKIQAAARHGIRLVVHPEGLPWLDPSITIELEGVTSAEDAVITATTQLHDLRSYLEAACRLVMPEPWMQAWLDREGRSDIQTPMLDVMCRPIHGDGAAAYAQDAADAADAVHVQPCPVHLLAETYPRVSFGISADAGAGCTIAAKRMVAGAARAALDALRAAEPNASSATITLPFYLPPRERPDSWEHLVQACVDAVPNLTEKLDATAALAKALHGLTTGGYRALVVVDGTDRARPSGSGAGRGAEPDFVAMLAGSSAQGGPAWQPNLQTQIVLCGRADSPAHQEAVASLCRLRGGSAGAVAVMELRSLGDRQIERFLAAFRADALSADLNWDLAANPLLLALAVVAGHRPSDRGATDLFDRGLDVLLGDSRGQRPLLTAVAFRAAISTGQPAGEFGIRDIAAPGSERAVEAALLEGDRERALTAGLHMDERDAITSAVRLSHLLTESSGGWRFFHDRAFAFLVADWIARRAAEGTASDDVVFGVLGARLGDPAWADVIEATGRLLELRSAVDSAVDPPDAMESPGPVSAGPATRAAAGPATRAAAGPATRAAAGAAAGAGVVAS